MNAMDLTKMKGEKIAMKKVYVIITLSTLLFWTNPILALEVYESELIPNAILVHLSAEEVINAKKGVNESIRYAEQVTSETLRMAGIPSSITGKVTMVAAWPGIITRFATGIYANAKSTSNGQNMTLKFHNINIQAVKKVWAASAVGDLTIPTAKEEKIVMAIINILTNVLIK